MVRLKSQLGEEKGVDYRSRKREGEGKFRVRVVSEERAFLSN